MHSPANVLWSEGLHFHIQHFQQQDRRQANLIHLTKNAIHPYVYGVHDVEVAVDELEIGILRLTVGADRILTHPAD